MKILIFSTAYLPFVGGAELAIKEITDRLPDISFTLITARFSRGVPARERIGNVEVYRVGFGTRFDKWFLPWLGLRKAKQLESTAHFDVLWSMMASQASLSATWFKELHQGKKLVLTLQEGDEEAHLKRYVLGNEFLYELFIRSWHVAVFKQANVITAISNYLADRARRNSSAEVEVIPNGVTVGKFQIPNSKSQTNSKSQNTEVRQRLGIKPEDKVVITTSRLVEKNGVGDLIEAMQYLPEYVKLLICGTGHLDRDYKLKAKSYQLEGRIRFLGHVPNEQLPDYLQSADIFCRPSLSEGLGISFLEAMAAGVPVVATPVGGIPDFLSDGGTGLFCEVNNPKSIAEKVQTLLSDSDLRTRIATNALAMVQEKYGWEGIAEKMKSVFVDKVD
ncbi:MAG: glycosyltransferase family 4 protein [bacterium]|nr:glycosyltransferase family 4 protein [bacterium]